MALNIKRTEIEIIKVEEGTKRRDDDKWFRVLGKDLTTNHSEFYSWWDTTKEPKLNKKYAIQYKESKPNDKGKIYKNIKDATEITIGAEGYIDVQESAEPAKEYIEKVTTTSAPVQKSYSEMVNADQIESLLNILIAEVKEIKEQVENVSSYIYNKDEMNNDKEDKEEK
jgi:exoribonuclease II